VYLWSKEYFRDREVSLYVLVALLFLWGKPFNYSNEYNIRFLAYTLFYPSTVTFSLSFLGLYLLLRYVRYETMREYFLYVFLGTFIFSTHPLTGSFFLLCAFLLTVTEGERRIKHLTLNVLSLFIIGLLSVLWPYYPFMDAVIKSTDTSWYFPIRMYLYDVQSIYKMGPALLGLPIVLLLLIRREYPFISLGFLLCSFVYISSYFLNVGLGERCIFFIMFFLHLSLAWYFSTLCLLSPRKIRDTITNLSKKNVHILFFIIILMAGIFYQVIRLGSEQAGYTISFNPKPTFYKYKNPLDNYTLLKDKVKESDIVMTDPLTGWLLPGLTGAKIVALYHDNPFVLDNSQRVNDAITFYESATPLHKREMILKKYHATHVLLNFDRMKENDVNRINNYYKDFRIDLRLLDDLKKIGEIIFKNDGLTLFELRHIS